MDTACLHIVAGIKDGVDQKAALPGGPHTRQIEQGPGRQINTHLFTYLVGGDMSRLAILGATGRLGKHVVRQALGANHDVSLLVRTPSKLPAEVRDRVSVHKCDLSSCSTEELSSLLSKQDAVINVAGVVTQGQEFVNIVDRIVSSLEAISTPEQPVCWFMAGAGLLDVDRAGRRGVDLPVIGKTYWPHRVNFERIHRSNLDWRVLCPGPMVERPPIGRDRLRTSIDGLPVDVPKLGRHLPGGLLLPLLGYLIAEMIISYADAASFVLANLEPGGPLSRHRVGLALPVGMRGKKDQRVVRSTTSA